MKISFSIVLLIFITLQISAQDFGSIRGFVTDSTNGEALPFCNVYLNEIKIGASTDQRGYYFINKIPSDFKYTIDFSYVGFQSKKIEVIIKKGKITELDVELIPSSYQLGEVEKIEQQFTKQDQLGIGIERVTLRDIELIPQTIESDVIRYLKHIPGVSSTGDVSAKYYVRGGTGDQNLVLLNGITVYNPFHALGLFSVIDADMVNSLEFFKGEFPSEYGGRISSIMNIATKDGNNNRYSTTASVSFLNAKVLLEGPYKFGSFIATGRKSYSTKILDNFFAEDNVPVDFYDFSFKANYSNQEFLENGRFNIFGFFSGDKFDDPVPDAADYTWGNNLFGFEWVQLFDRPFFSRFQFSYSSFNGKVVSNNSDVKPRSNSVNDFTFSAEFTLVRENKDQITVGLHFKNIGTEVEQEQATASIVKLDDFSGNYILFAKYELLQFDDFGFDAGTRIYLSGLSNKGGMSVEPRVKAFWQLFPSLLLKASVGSYRQEIATIADENEVISLFDPWTIYPDYLDATRSINISFGMDYYFVSNFKFTLDLYYRKIKNLAVINEQKIFPEDPALLNGDGEAYGLETSFSIDWNRFTFNSSYTLGWAFKTVNGVEYHPKYDSRHNINLLANYALGKGWDVSATWSYNSGYPFTPLRGYFDRYELNSFFDYNPALDMYSIYTVLGQKNVKRLPDYHRLDLSLSKSFQIGSVNIDANVSLINVYDRKNIFYFKSETGERVNMLPLLPTASLRVKL